MLRRNAALTDLQLVGMNLGDGDLSLIARAIEGHQTVMSLNVSRNTFRVPGIMDLMSMARLVPTLREVDLVFYSLNSEALAILTIRLLGNKTVQKLDLSGNEINDNSAILFSSLLRGNEVLKILRVGACNLSSAGFRHIVAGGPCIECCT